MTKGHKGQMPDRDAMKLALEALEDIHPGNMTPMAEEYWGKAITALRQALEKEKTMPITDDHGQAIQPQYRVIESCGKWHLLYDAQQIGNQVVHEFRIQKITHDITLYRGISLAEAKKRFYEKVEESHEQ